MIGPGSQRCGCKCGVESNTGYRVASCAGVSRQRAVVRANVCLNERPPAMRLAVWFERLVPTPRGEAQVERKVYDNGAGAFERVLPAQ